VSVAESPDLTATLAAWKGAWAQPWDYTTSHGTLRIKVARRGEAPCVILLLKDCSRVSFADSWDGFNPTIETYQGAFGIRYRVTDSGNLDVDCGAVHVSRQLDSYAAIPDLPFEVR
jgi:hypothetical protein